MRQREPGQFYNILWLEKTKLMNRAFNKFNVRSFVDLGGCFAVHGGYTLAALLHFRIERAAVVDGRPTADTVERLKPFPKAEIIQGYFGDDAVLEKVGAVDAIIMFDILLHQADPDWRQIVKAYTARSKVIVVYNPNWIGSRNSVRLRDLGRDEWLRNTGDNYDSEGNLRPGREQFLDKGDEIHPAFNQPWRDTWLFWQWGITDADLINEMWENGFALDFQENYGSWFGLPNFERHGFIFNRVKPWQY